MMRNISQPTRDKPSPLKWVTRLFALLVVVAACLLASVFLYARWQDARLGGFQELASGAADLNPIELMYLESYLALNADALNSPAGTSAEMLSFDIRPGETADIIAGHLKQAGLLEDEELFVRYVQYAGIDHQLEAGSYRLNPQMSIRMLASVLTEARIQEVEIRFLNGWRIAEMVEYLKATRPANIDPQEFALIAEGRAGHELSDYEFLSSRPAGASLEGYLFPGRYRIPVDIDAPYLIDLMLDEFDRQISEGLRTSYETSGLTIHDAVTLASIIEKETTVEGEMPLMASVYLNRLKSDTLLQADPTVQFARGFDEESGSWWKSPLDAADLSVDSPYNTYIYPGLPPGPITNPALGAMQSVAAPAETEFMFFVAGCDVNEPGSHIFSFTFDEHLANVNRCRTQDE